MRLALSNDEWFYVEQNNVKLVDINGEYHIVGGSILYGVSESGTRYRLNPDVSTSFFEEYSVSSQIVGSEYDVEEDVYIPVYADVGSWSLTNLTLDTNYSIPNSMNANDTYNFDNFSSSYVLVLLLVMFIVFRLWNK